MTDGQVIKSLWDKGLGTWEIHEITGLPEHRVYNALSAYRKERYSVYESDKTSRKHKTDWKTNDLGLVESLIEKWGWEENW